MDGAFSSAAAKSLVVDPCTLAESREVHFMAMMEKVPTKAAYAEQGNQPFWWQTKYTRDQVEQVVFQDTQEGAPDSAILNTYKKR